MVPIMDLFNHGKNINTSWKYDTLGDKEGFILKATTQIPAGTQLMIEYGKYANHALLYQYGFVTPDNMYNVPAFLAHKLDPQDPLFEKKKQLLGPRVDIAFHLNGVKDKVMS